MRDVVHHGIGPLAFDKGLQLILDVLRLLTRQPGHWGRSAKTLRIYAMAGLAVVRLSLERLRRNAGPRFAFGMSGRGCDRKHGGND